ncbi:DUF4320 family protein [Exiguobacterium antarcticum]|uniref:DUF4320 family protein n=1 Tax=Exiguobacterium antarcticum TaxID=132920 RepID=A0ABT6R550_9BACL|nr:DUF4320 family protein [Exiguobacterium antarcticum]MDI3235963.1 DUF4320 family protein [Exiguobacterium antarcticum]
MQNTVATAIFITILLVLTLLIPEGLMMSNEKTNLQNLANDAVELAERQGGFDYEYEGVKYSIINQIEKRMENEKLGNYKISYTQGRVQHNEPLTFEIEGTYRYEVFNLLGITNMDFPLHAKKHGVSEVLFR